MPLLSKNEVIGVLNVIGADLSKNDIELMQLFANHISIALENSFLLSSLNQAETSKQELENRFQSLIDQSPFSTVIYSPDGQALYGNKATLEMWGLSDIDAQRIYDSYNILQDPQLEELGAIEHIKKGFEGVPTVTPPILYKLPATSPDDESPNRYTRAFVNPIWLPNGGISEVVVLIEDITERVLVEQALQESESQYRTLVNNVNVGVYRSSADPAKADDQSESRIGQDLWL